MRIIISLCALMTVWAAMLSDCAMASPETDKAHTVPLDPPPAAPEVQPEDPNKPEKCGYMECLSLLPPMDDVYYTVQKKLPVFAQASQWGIPSNVLIALNPDLSYDTQLTPGTKLLVDTRISSGPVPYSSGKCSHGRLSNARIMPEGDGYFLRSNRPRSWGTDDTIQALMTLFHEYHSRFPDAPAINVGDISKRRGGKAKPHKSHQSGRDVDIGFVHTSATDANHPDRFIRADASNLDVEKTWFLVETLVRTGRVKVIYVDRSVMKLLRQYAEPKLTPQQLEHFFSYPRHTTSQTAVLQHWPGHKNHFHIRFICPENQPGCRH